jgi:GTPase SAR1 family protein
MAKERENPVLIKTEIVRFQGSGKSSLLITYTTGKFTSEYIPTIFDNYSQIELNGCSYHVGSIEPAGGEDYPNKNLHTRKKVTRT